jgi:hypothetical protein
MVTLTVAFVLSLLLWLGLQVNDQFVSNRDAAYVPILLKLQHYGMDQAKQWFPCGKDGSTGCEPYKTVPAVVLLNTVVFFAVLLIPIHILRRFSTTLDV